MLLTRIKLLGCTIQIKRILKKYTLLHPLWCHLAPLFVFPPSTSFQAVLSEWKVFKPSICLWNLQTGTSAFIDSRSLYQRAIQKNSAHCSLHSKMKKKKNTHETNTYAACHGHRELHCGFSLLGGVNEGKEGEKRGNCQQELDPWFACSESPHKDLLTV